MTRKPVLQPAPFSDLFQCKCGTPSSVAVRNTQEQREPAPSWLINDLLLWPTSRTSDKIPIVFRIASLNLFDPCAARTEVLFGAVYMLMVVASPNPSTFVLTPRCPTIYLVHHERHANRVGFCLLSDEISNATLSNCNPRHPMAFQAWQLVATTLHKIEKCWIYENWVSLITIEDWRSCEDCVKVYQQHFWLVSIQ